MVSAWQRAWACAVLAVALFGIVACGGGGGGAGNSFSVKLDRSNVAFSYLEGGTPGAEHVIATGSGDLPSGVTTLYVLAEVQGAGIDPAIGVQFSGLQADFSLVPTPGLAPGTYNGRIALYACMDAACRQTIGGTPLYVTYNIQVAAALKADRASVEVGAVGGNEASATLQVQLPTGETSFTASAVGEVPWLELQPPAGSSLAMRFKPWRSGTYTASIMLNSGGQSRTLPVTYVVSLPPGGEHDLAVTPQGLNLGTTENATSASQVLTLSLPSWNATPPALQVTYEGAAAGWVTTEATGVAYTVSASASNLPAGVYRANIRFTPPAPGTAVSVPVVLSVGPGLVPPAPLTIVVNGETSASGLMASAPVQMAGGPALVWTATSEANWLVLQKDSGLTGDSVAFTVDKTALVGMANYSDLVGRVIVRTAASNVGSMSFNVTLSKRLPEVLGLGPYLLVSGRTSYLNVWGRGFNGVEDVAARLHLPGVTASQVTRLSDNNLRVTLTPTAAGQGTVSVENAMQLASSGAALRVTDPQTYPYRAIPTGTQVRAMVLDAERRSVFAVNLGNESLTRFRHTGGSDWAIDGLSVPAISEVGLAPDGSSVVVASRTGRLRLVDPVSLAVTFTLDHSAPFSNGFTYLGHPIPATYDGRSWLTQGGTWHDLVYFDHATRSIKSKPPGIATSFYDGPWMAGSRDGARMLVVQSAGITPTPPMLAWDTLAGALAINPAGLTFSYEMHLSDDGARAILDALEVRDREFGLVGRTLLPSTHMGLVGAMAPDGQRAYVLGYPADYFGVLNTNPTVFVFDTSAANPLSSSLTLVGQFDLQHFPTCTISDYSCNLRPRVAISPDGSTLFFLGDANLVVAPIPANVRAASLMKRPFAVRKTMQAQPWRLGPQSW